MKPIIVLFLMDLIIYIFANDIEKNGKVALFQRLFKLKREEHKGAVQVIKDYQNYEKQYKMIEIIATKSFSVLQECQIKLKEAGYTPGMDIPHNESIKDTLSLLLENTVFLGEILLHLPDITHKILDKHKESNLFFTWGIMFTSQAPFLDTSTKKLIYLVTQELGLTEEDSNYQNPYHTKPAHQKVPHPKTAKPKERKSFKKGPRLSRNEL